ncbi:DUF4860 domain-containing protein [Anoxynatronum buryatiense]|uniref:Uncharacterized protein n=1 Tax=Anoxynatronum buryatiense TaxID=489973 RepID=A0AA46AJK4_9CLOT|nr:DUF4860 domain-containing protein [Anoxynatronum buryatiense]SMP62882.1 protein of unknown function [Anoxynatronum buryatiense]
MKRFQFLHHRQGHSLTELLLVMALLLFFGTASFTLMAAGNRASQQVIDRQQAQSQLRTAAAYLNTRLRQQDSQNAVTLRPHPETGQTALVLTEVYYGELWETWVYHRDGTLREVQVIPGDPVRDDFSFKIALLDTFEVAMEEGTTLHFQMSMNVENEILNRNGYYRPKAGIAGVE